MTIKTLQKAAEAHAARQASAQGKWGTAGKRKETTIGYHYSTLSTTIKFDPRPISTAGKAILPPHL
ncbi:hypothetical protein HBH51_140610 [Parastagonospora nodorum]|nr:hypothetical protein HBH51_140610 [Parastagonospora nodorum]KAH5258304.1 hypothetical protein HBI71_122600 [Parastagonospora nodorum]